MEIEVKLNGFEGRNITVKTAQFFSGAKLLINGEEAKKEKRRYILKDNEGQLVEIKFKMNFLDPIPKLVVNNSIVEIARPLKWHEYLFMGLPALLIFWGGALGGGLGFAASYSIGQVFRSRVSTPLKYVYSLLISMCTVIIFLIIAFLINQKIRGIQ